MCKGFHSIFRLVKNKTALLDQNWEHISNWLWLLTVAYLHEKLLHGKQVTVWQGGVSRM